MGDILGMGLTHAPMFQFPDENMADILRRFLQKPEVPAEFKDPARWPAEMRAEWGDDEGLSAARRHREAMVAGFRRLRAELDAFAPDFVLIFGDDQYENFHEDLVPPFCVYLFDSMDCLPYRPSNVINTKSNVWGQPPDKTLSVRGHARAGSYLARELLLNDVDVAWSMRPHHHQGLSHAFMRTVMYLDYDQRGFDYPLVPFHVNCYGQEVMRQAGAGADQTALAPPGPTPRRCFDVGAAVARILAASPWRAVIIGSSSWSHAFLTRKHHGVYPDVQADRLRLAELQASRHRVWRDLPPESLLDAGQHEFLNWICLAGAMAERRADVVAVGETFVFNSDKVAALFPAA